MAKMYQCPECSVIGIDEIPFCEHDEEKHIIIADTDDRQRIAELEAENKSLKQQYDHDTLALTEQMDRLRDLYVGVKKRCGELEKDKLDSDRQRAILELVINSAVERMRLAIHDGEKRGLALKYLRSFVDKHQARKELENE